VRGEARGTATVPVSSQTFAANARGLAAGARVPALAENHRRLGDQFVVAAAHFDDVGIAARACDQFFVVELGGPRRSDFR